MTTTPAAYPELPDLDRLQRIADEIDEAGLFTASGELRETIHNLRRAQPEGEAPQAEAPAPSAAVIDDVVDNLREYASNAGYSHNDYQDTMRQAANTIEALRAQLWHWGPLAAQQAAAPEDVDLRKDEATRLRRVVRAMGIDHQVPGNDARLRDCLFSVLGIIAGKLESAPGTPEAPRPIVMGIDWSTDYLTEQRAAMRDAAAQLVENAQEGSLRADTARAIRALDATPRAAQLDGGQGEKA